MDFYNLEAEEYLIGAILINNDILLRVNINPNDFYGEYHKIMFELILKLASQNKNINKISLVNEYKTIQANEQEGDLFLLNLVTLVSNHVGGWSSIEECVDIIVENAAKRRAIQFSHELVEKIKNPNGIKFKDLLNYLQRDFLKISLEIETKKKLLNDYLMDFVEETSHIYNSKADFTGLSSGFSSLDEITKGFQNKNLIIIAARPSMGKTTFVLNIAENVCINNSKSVAFFTLEVGAEEIVRKLISSVSKVSQEKFKTGKFNDNEYSAMTAAIGKIYNKKLFIEDEYMDANKISFTCRKLINEHGKLDLIIIDYLQIIAKSKSSYQNDNIELGNICKQLKALAKELNVPVIVLSQLNRALEGRTEKTPTLSDLRGSGEIEQDADLVMFIHREEVYNQNKDKGLADVLIKKQRNGRLGDIKLKFIGEYSRFEELR